MTDQKLRDISAGIEYLVEEMGRMRRRIKTDEGLIQCLYEIASITDFPSGSTYTTDLPNHIRGLLGKAEES